MKGIYTNLVLSGGWNSRGIFFIFHLGKKPKGQLMFAYKMQKATCMLYLPVWNQLTGFYLSQQYTTVSNQAETFGKQTSA